MMFLSPEVALYLYNSIRPYMKYCCPVWSVSLVATRNCQASYKNEYGGLLILCLLFLLKPLAHHQNVTSLNLILHYFGICSSELAKLVPLPLSGKRSTCYSDRLHDFSVTIPRCYKDILSAVSFLTQLDLGILCLQSAFL